MREPKKIKACPFCGDSEFLHLEKINLEINENENEDDEEPLLKEYASEQWFIMCGSCGTMGPLGNDPEEAEEKWNRRNKK